MEIYRRPANLFVANFMGDREMNIFEGEIIADGPRQAFRAGTLRLAFPDGGPWAGFAGRKLALGVRPEGVLLGARPGAVACQARLRLVEHAGAEQIFFAETDGAEFCGKAGPDLPLRPGEMVPLSLLGAELYLFDVASGQALVHGGVPLP
jgi:ABC-type sugar transport system ATPase subunit